MKNLIVKTLQKLSLVFTSMLLAFISFAQDKKIDVDINTKSGDDGNFLTKPWVWVVGAAVFILLLVAIIRGNSNNKS